MQSGNANGILSPGQIDCRNPLNLILKLSDIPGFISDFVSYFPTHFLANKINLNSDSLVLLKPTFACVLSLAYIASAILVVLYTIAQRAEAFKFIIVAADDPQGHIFTKLIESDGE